MTSYTYYTLCDNPPKATLQPATSNFRLSSSSQASESPAAIRQDVLKRIPYHNSSVCGERQRRDSSLAFHGTSFDNSGTAIMACFNSMSTSWHLRSNDSNLSPARLRSSATGMPSRRSKSISMTRGATSVRAYGLIPSICRGYHTSSPQARYSKSLFVSLKM